MRDIAIYKLGVQHSLLAKSKKESVSVRVSSYALSKVKENFSGISTVVDVLLCDFVYGDGMLAFEEEEVNKQSVPEIDPADEVSVYNNSPTFQDLLDSGMDINEAVINIKHIAELEGRRLQRIGK